MQKHKATLSPLVVLLAITASLTGVMAGMDTGIIGESQRFIYATFHVTSPGIKSFTVAAVPLSAMIGAIISSWPALRLGRRNTLFISGIIFSIGVMSIVTAHHINSVIIGRLLMGLSGGLSLMVTPLYLAELAPTHRRGMLVFMFQLAITIGILLAAILNDVFADTENWRVMFALCLCPALLLLIGLIFLPRSPRWLMQVKRWDEAKSVMQQLGHHDVNAEFNAIKASLSHPKFSLAMLRQPHFRTLILLTVSLFLFQQLSGINTIFYFVDQVFSAAYHSVDGRALASVIACTVNVIATLVAIYLIDTLGRRKLMLSSMLCCVVFLLIIAMAFKGYFGTFSGIISLAGVLGFIACFAIGLGGVPYIVAAEVFPIHVRHIGVAVASASSWLFNFIVSITYLHIVNSVGLDKTYLCYAFCTIIGAIMIWRYMPETKGISLEDIEAHFVEHKTKYALKPRKSLAINNCPE